MRRILLLLATVVALTAPATASAAVTPSRDADAIAGAMATGGAQGTITSAAFTEIPPTGNPEGIVDSTLGGFPTDGSSFAVLTTGDATLADDGNTAANSGADDGGAQGHGDPGNPGTEPGNAYDTSILRVNFTTPPAANCLSIGFRFLSEEFPEFVGGSVNDGFIAQLDASDWITFQDGSISAPGNFAFDDQGNVVSVNTSGASAAEAAGTTYDGATPKLTASRELTSGAHSLYLSIFDQDDNAYDSAAFLDSLDFSTTAPGACVRGAQPVDTTPPAVSLAVSPNGNTPSYSGTAGADPTDSGTVTVNVYAGAATSGAPVQTLTATRTGTAWGTDGAALADGQYTAVAQQSDTAGNTGLSAPVGFTAAAPVPDVPDLPDEPPVIPVPKLGQSVVASVVSGTVRFKTKHGKFRTLRANESIPLGSTVDATKGKVRLTSAANGAGATQSALFYQGQFAVTQTKGAKPITQLALNGKLSCAKKKKRGQKATVSAKRKKVRRLWGDGKGRFRTKGKYGAATVRGTKWLTEDRCSGTLVRVKRGKVAVRDFTKRKTVLVKQRHVYVARAKK